MSQYYLMSQLPALDCISDSAPVPITEERFSELCNRFLGKKSLNCLNKLTLLPPREPQKTSSPLVNAWNESERNLRLALAYARANKRKKVINTENNAFPIELMQTAQSAVQMDDPMEAEKFLNRYRLDILEALRPMDAFSEEAVFYYGLKLKLLLRIRRFDEEKGRVAYKSIYGSVLRDDKQEVTQ